MPPPEEERRRPRLSAALWVPQKRWTPQEAWIWERVLAGEVADLKQRYGEAHEARRVSERFLLDVLTVPSFTAAVPHHGLRIMGAWFPAPLDLSDTAFGHQVWLGRCRFDGKVSFRTVRLGSHLSLEGSTFGGDIDLVAAKVEGILDASGATFEGRLDMEALAVGGHLLLRGAAFEGKVSLLGAKVSGQLVASAATFAAGLNMEALEVGQTLFLRRSNQKPFEGKGATLRGEVVLHGAQVGGALALSGAIFKDKVDLVGARVGGNLDVSDATLHGTLDASGAVIEGELRLGSSHHPRAHWEPGVSLVLRNTAVGALQDQLDQEPGGKLLDAWPGKLQLDGFAYRRLGGLGGEGESEMIARPASWYEAWLKRDGSFSPQPYRQLANVFREAGADDKANAILYALRERERAEAWRRGAYSRWLGLGLLKWVIGYGIGAGYFWALAWAALFTLIGTLVLRFGGTPPWLTPGWLEQVQGLEGLRWCFWASLDEILPLVELNKAHAEFVDTKLADWRQDYFYVHRTIGYVLGSFVVAGLAGLTQGR